MLYTGEKLSSPIFCCLSVCQASVSPDQISTFSNIYRHTSPLLTMYHLISSSTNLYWPSTSQYRHILTQYHQVPLIIHHLMSQAQYTWSSFTFSLPLKIGTNSFKDKLQIAINANLSHLVFIHDPDYFLFNGNPKAIPGEMRRLDTYRKKPKTWHYRLELVEVNKLNLPTAPCNDDPN